MESDFDLLISRLRKRDDSAASEFVERYGPELRREIRLMLWNSAIRKAVDSEDLWQSVMFSVFKKLCGDKNPIRAAELSCLLRVIADHKTTSLIRRQYAAKRDVRRSLAVLDEMITHPPCTDPTPSEALHRKELLEHVQSSLSPEDRHLLKEYSLKCTWVEIAEKRNITANAARKRFVVLIKRLKQLVVDRFAYE